MTSDEMARDYLDRARARRLALGVLMDAAAYADVVRQSQEVVELIFTGTLRFVGVDPPKRHDVHLRVAHFFDRLPAEWRDAVGQLGPMLDRLSEGRSLAFYGDEDRGVPASELFGEDDARQAILVVDRLLDLYTRLLAADR